MIRPIYNFKELETAELYCAEELATLKAGVRSSGSGAAVSSGTGIGIVNRYSTCLGNPSAPFKHSVNPSVRSDHTETQVCQKSLSTQHEAERLSQEICTNLTVRPHGTPFFLSDREIGCGNLGPDINPSIKSGFTRRPTNLCLPAYPLSSISSVESEWMLPVPLTANLYPFVVPTLAIQPSALIPARRCVTEMNN